MPRPWQFSRGVAEPGDPKQISTDLANERTLLAWLRTGLAAIRRLGRENGPRTRGKDAVLGSFFVLGLPGSPLKRGGLDFPILGTLLGLAYLGAPKKWKPVCVCARARIMWVWLKIKELGQTAGVSLWFPFPKVPFWYLFFLSHSHVRPFFER